MALGMVVSGGEAENLQKKPALQRTAGSASEAGKLDPTLACDPAAACPAR